MRALLGSSSYSLIGVLHMKLFTASAEQMSWPLHWSQSSCFVKPKGLTMNTGHFLVISFPLLICHSALRRVISLLLRMSPRLARICFSSSVDLLYLFWRVQSSCLRCSIWYSCITIKTGRLGGHMLGGHKLECYRKASWPPGPVVTPHFLQTAGWA